MIECNFLEHIIKRYSYKYDTFFHATQLIVVRNTHTPNELKF